MPSKLRRKAAPLFAKLGGLKKLLVFVFFAAIVIFLTPGIFSFLQKLFTVERVVTSLVLNRDIDLKKEQGAINILALGIGGGDHEGPLLSDTVIFVHIDPQKNTIVLLSIPRDLWVGVLENKINTAYATGEEKKKGGGLTLAKATVAEMLDQPVHYGIRIDFAGFVRGVDELGGLDIDVDGILDDYSYPIDGKENDTCGKGQEEVQNFATASAEDFSAFPCRYEHIHFDKGPQHMNGETALKYVRSRHGMGDEGSDFARSRRQQKVISAVREKVLSLAILFNPIKITQLVKILGDSVDTDITIEEIDDFIRLAQKMKNATIINYVLDQGDDAKDRAGLLTNPPINKYGAWVLEPRTGDFSEIKRYVSCLITKPDCVVDK